jgi:hypothetical protein
MASAADGGRSDIRPKFKLYIEKRDETHSCVREKIAKTHQIWG